MQTDADIQVWLNNTAQAQTQVIVPYVSSSSAQDLRYRIRAVQEKDSNRAVIGQTGVIHIAADTPAAISRLSLNRHPGERCEIEIMLTGRNFETLRYVFECP